MRSAAETTQSSVFFLALMAIVLLTAINLFFHAFFQGPLRISGLICSDAYHYFPGPLLDSTHHSVDYRFTDYFDTQWFKPGSGQTSQLPPATILLYQAFAGLTQLVGSIASLVTFTAFQLVLFSASLARLMESAAMTVRLPAPARPLIALLLTLCSYPVYFAIDRGHFSLLLCALLLFALDAHSRNRRWLAAFLIGIAAGLRITPLLFIAVYLNRSDFRYALAAVVTMLSTWVFALAILPVWLPDYSLDTWIRGILDYQYLYSSWPRGLGWSSSLFNLVRYVRYQIGIPADAILDSAASAESFYSLVSLLILALVVLRARSATPAIAWGLLTWAWLALPHITADYYLALLIGAMILLMSEERPDLVSVGLIVLLLVPKDYFYYYATVNRLFDIRVPDIIEYNALLRNGLHPVSVQSLFINPALLLALGLRLFWLDLRRSAASN